jgi:hypothetical protein
MFDYWHFLSTVRITPLFFRGVSHADFIDIQRLSALYSVVRQEAAPGQAPDKRLDVLATSVQSVTSDNYDNRVLRTTYKCNPICARANAWNSLGPS